jgi:hypothetical protein
MYGSSLIGLQWEAAIAGIDGALEHEVREHGLDYMLDIDDLLERRHRLKTAIDQAHMTGELPMVHEPSDRGTELHDPEALGL